MSLTKQLAGLAATLSAQAAEKKARADKEAAQTAETAAAFDEQHAGRASLPIPYLAALITKRVTLYFRGVNPETLAALMDAFPAMPRGLQRGRDGTSYPLGTERKEGHEFTPGDGFKLYADKHESRQTLRMEWTCNLAGRVPADMRVELLNVHGVTADQRGRVRTDATGRVCSIDDVSLQFPIGKPAALQVIRYSRHSPAVWPSMLAWAPRGESSAMRAMVQCWVDECDRRGVESRTAYERDRDSGAIEPEPVHSPGKLRAGSAAQTDCLNTLAARVDQALARKHWRAYTADRAGDPWPVKPSEYSPGFNHYSWACNWLARHGLYEDAALPTKDGKPYRYGSAWL